MAKKSIALPPMPPSSICTDYPAGIYLRRSDDDQSSFSPEAQERIARMQCATYGLRIVEIYFDDDYSGTRADRPAFERMQRDVAAGRIRYVVVPKIDRFARDVVICLLTVDKLQTLGARVISVAEPFDFTTPAGRLMLTNMAGQAEYFSRNLSTEVKKGLYEKAERGGFIGLPPLGYRTEYSYDARGAQIPKSGRLVQTGDAATVLLIGQLYATGNHSGMTITEELNSRGLTGIDPHTGQRIPFQKDGVMGILKNPVYRGIVRCGGKEYPGNHDPIFSPDLWSQIEVVLHRRSRIASDGQRRGSIGSPPIRGEGGLLSELAYCGLCGAKMHWQISGNRDRGQQCYYRCSHRRRFGVSACSADQVPARTIEPMVVDVLRLLVIPSDIQERVISEVQRRLQRPVAPQTYDHDLLKRRLQRLKTAWLSGDEDITDEVYYREKAKIDEQLRATQPAMHGLLDVTKALQLLGNIPLLLEAAANDALKRSLIQQIFEMLWLEKGKVTAIKATKNLDLLVDVALQVGGTTSTGINLVPPTIPHHWIIFQIPYRENAA